MGHAVAAAEEKPRQTSARVLFLRADFPDAQSTRQREEFQNPAESGLVDRLGDYYARVSGNRFAIEPVFSEKVYRLPKRRAAYVNRPTELIADALTLAARPEPLGEKSLLEGIDPDVVFLFFAGPGAESDIEKRHRGLPWSNAISGQLPSPIATWRGPSGVVVAEDPLHELSPFGVMAHEFGHILGLPELYAPGKTHEGIGIWGLMGQGTWVGMGNHPPALSAWSKLKLGWVDPVVVETSQKVELPAVAEGRKVVKIFARGAQHPQEYFLLENRRKRGTDERLPGEGLLIWHIDESQDSFRRSQDDPERKRVDLLTADSWPSHLDLGHTRGGNRGDAGDPFANQTHAIGPKTTPGTGSHDGTRGRFSIRNVGPIGDVMTFDVVFEPQPSASPG